MSIRTQEAIFNELINCITDCALAGLDVEDTKRIAIDNIPNLQPCVDDFMLNHLITQKISLVKRGLLTKNGYNLSRNK
tara:strand:+ start:2421 stop:2654 length:234 start_codon:yes stop_codon:yes gene_type:complete